MSTPAPTCIVIARLVPVAVVLVLPIVVIVLCPIVVGILRPVIVVVLGPVQEEVAEVGTAGYEDEAMGGENRGGAFVLGAAG